MEMARRPSSEEIRFTIRQRNIAASTGETCQRMYVRVVNEVDWAYLKWQVIQPAAVWQLLVVT